MILLTGSSGFIGSNLSKELDKRKIKYLPVSRSKDHSKKKYFYQIPDIDGGTNWTDALKDCSSVIHTAARVHVMKDSSKDPLSKFRKVNVAGTINFKNGNCFYGRYWGCKGNYRSLHFELCYYQPIEYAIRKGFSLYEAGAQGEHKIQRGFLPEITYSAHCFEHPGFHSLVSKFLEEEKASINQGIKEFGPHSPYR